MNTKEISVLMSLAMPCATAPSTASLTVPAAHQPIRLPADKPEPEHPPHGQGSGEIITFTGISSSGAMANVNAIITTNTWQPPLKYKFDSPGQLFEKHVQNYRRLNMTITQPRRPLTRIRQSC